MKQKIKQKILIYETDRQLGILLKDVLSMRDYEVELVHSPEVGYAVFTSGHYDYCILELNHDKKSEFNLGTNIRLISSSIPIIFLIPRFFDLKKIHGYNDTFSEYLPKPFGVDELLYHLGILMTKAQKKVFSLDGLNNGTFNIGKFNFDSSKRELSFQHEVQMLTSKENELLTLFAFNANSLVERAFALEAIWNENSYLSARSMDVYVTKLRRKLASDPAIALMNVRGRGYKLSIPVKERTGLVS